MRPSSSTRSQEAEFAVLELALPGRPPEASGVLLLDGSSEQLHVRLRRDWAEIAGEEDAELLEALAEDLQVKLMEMGSRGLLDYFEETLSNVLRISDREPTSIHGSAELTLTELYRNYVRPKVLPFRTHLPVFYDLRAAAGSFSPDRAAGQRPEEWLETPDGVRLGENMFIGRVEGRSMEPKIPDGSLCIFRANPVGSREGRILLVERIADIGSEVTVKVYRSLKTTSSEGEWKHLQITMEPLNPEFSAWTLREGEQLHVIAEFIDVLR